MTKDKGLDTFKEEITREKRKMEQEFILMKQLVEENASLSKRIEKSNLVKYIKAAQGLLGE